MKSYARNTTFRPATVLLFSLLAMASVAVAQLPVPASSQFDITGFLQEATVTSTGDAHSGGTLKINGHTVTVPRETIVILPANALTWQEMFAKAPAPYTGVATGMALADIPTPLTTYEFEVIGNRVGDTYIAGLIFMSQQALNSGAGFINFINYATGEMNVGGQIVVDALGNPVLSGTNPGTRVRLNDPVGRYGRIMSPDVRFTVDPDNPTITAATGYPMCLPRTAPVGGVTTDVLCPEGNRPITVAASPTSPAVYSTNFTTNNLTNPGFPMFPGVFPDSTLQAPFEVGDWITFAGTLVTDNTLAPTTGPWPGTASTYISAHTIVNNVAIYTFPSSNPAYVKTDVTLIGTGGLTVLGAGEAVIRTRFEGMTTDVDPSGAAQRKIHLYGIDLTSAGVTSDRDWGTIGVDPGPPNGAVKGRWRFRPPCLPFGSVPAKPDKDCVMNQSGTFLPPTREMRAVIEGLQSQDPANPGAIATANGLFYGQYHAPITLYIFPENVPGAPIVENNFNSIPFLACGGYTSSGIPGGAGTLVGILNPWPSNIAPNTSSCVGLVTAPSNVVATASPSSVISGTGTLVTLNATAAGTLPLSFAWTQAPTDVPEVVLTNPNTATATFTTPVVAANTTLHFTVTVTNSAGSASGVTSVSVAVDIPIVNHVAPQTVFSGTPVTMIITGNDPAGLPLTFAVTQTAGPAPDPPGLVLTQNPPSGATLNFTYTLPIGAPAATLNFSIVATNTAGASSAPEFTSVTVNPLPDSLSITNAEYRTAKQRLIVNVTDATVNPAINVFLNPYRCEVNAPPCTPQANGTWMYNPDPAAGGVGNVFTFAPGGLYTIDVTGAPKPACNLGGTYATPCGVASISVRSSQGGTASSVLTKIRQ